MGININIDLILLGFNTVILLVIFFGLYKLKNMTAQINDQHNLSNLEIIKSRNLAESLAKNSTIKVTKNIEGVSNQLNDQCNLSKRALESLKGISLEIEKSMLEIIKSRDLAETLTKASTEEVLKSVGAVSNQLNDQGNLSNLALESLKGVSLDIEKSVSEIIKSRDLAETLTKASTDKVLKGVETASNKNTNILTGKITQLSSDSKTGLFDLRASSQSNLERISELVQSIRIQNISELINELASHQELKLETEDSIKHLGGCKVTRIEDKQTGQDTQIFYENGQKSISETYQGNNLKYRMQYNEAGMFVKGIEYDDNGNTVFEYEYDEAGEVVCKHQYVYTEDAQPQKITTQYRDKE